MDLSILPPDDLAALQQRILELQGHQGVQGQIQAHQSQIQVHQVSQHTISPTLAMPGQPALPQGSSNGSGGGGRVMEAIEEHDAEMEALESKRKKTWKVKKRTR